MKSIIKNNYFSYFQVVLIPLTLLLTWWLLSIINSKDSLYLPNLSQVANKLTDFFSADEAINIMYTLSRTLIAFAIAVIIGVPFGILLGMNRRLYSMFEVIIDFFRSFPATALLPLFLFFFGIGETAKLALAVFVCFWIILIHSISGVWNSPAMYSMVAEVFRATRLQKIRYILFFGALPEIFVGMRIALSLSLVMVIVAEMMMGSKYGLGKLIFDSYLSYQMDLLYATLIITGLLGYSLNKLFRLLEQRVVHWSGK